jgi:hypothetical protein
LPRLLCEKAIPPNATLHFFRHTWTEAAFAESLNVGIIQNEVKLSTVLIVYKWFEGKELCLRLRKGPGGPTLFSAE